MHFLTLGYPSFFNFGTFFACIFYKIALFDFFIQEIPIVCMLGSLSYKAIRNPKVSPQEEPAVMAKTLHPLRLHQRMCSCFLGTRYVGRMDKTIPSFSVKEKISEYVKMNSSCMIFLHIPCNKYILFSIFSAEKLKCILAF